MSDQTLPILAFSGPIHLIEKDEQLAAALAVLGAEKELGFDTETRPSFKKGEVYKVALLQLASGDQAFLFRMHHLHHFEGLRQLFQNPEIIKVGVAIRDDLKQLQKVFKFEPAGFVELQTLAKDKGLQNFGLQGMTEEVLNGHLSKAAKLTNWEASELTPPQQKYAATDAWIGLQIYQKLIKNPVVE